MIKAVIFDMDGVLIDTEKYLVKCWCEAAGEFGFDMQQEHALLIRSLAGKFAKPLLKDIFGETFDYEKIRMRRKERMQEALLEKGIEKKPGVDFLLNELKKRGIKTAVATATDEERAGRYLKEAGIFDKFNQIICASMVENGKPMPDIYEYAVLQIGEDKENCLAVEDSPNGVLAAYRAGIKTIMVPDLTLPEEAQKQMVYGICPSLKEIVNYL